MTMEVLTDFLLWCSIINGGLLLFSTVLFVFASDFVYSVHSLWFSIPRENYDTAIFSYLGMYNIGILVFNLVAYVALRVVG
jgi:hypothetical protein